MSETIQFYRTLFNQEIPKDDEYYNSFYTVNVHVNGLKSVIASNLDKNVQEIDSPEADVKLESIRRLIHYGVNLYGEAIEYPESTKRVEVEEDITNFGKTPVINAIDFNSIDENDRLQFIGNIIKIIRHLMVSVQEAGFELSSLEKFDRFFTMNQWFLIKLVPNFDMVDVNQMILMIVKETIYIIFDYLMWSKHLEIDFIDILNDILIKTHPKVNDSIELPTVKLSIETLVKIFMIIGILNTGQLHIKNSDQFALQLEPILLYNLKLSYTYTPDLFNYRVMNDSFFHWVTANMLNFQDSYVNSTFIQNININQPKYLVKNELISILDNRFKACKSQQRPNFEVKEFLPLSLYINSVLDNSKHLESFLNHEISRNWLCLLSYCYQYQYMTKTMIISTRLSLIIINKLVSYDHIDTLTIDEYKWKLCHQKLPIVGINNGSNTEKPLLSYILDNLSVLIKFNLNKKLNVPNFINVVKLIHIIISKQIDNDYNYSELIKSLMSLLIFGEQFLSKPSLTNEILKLFNNVLSLSIKQSLIYEILLMYDKFFKLGIDSFPNLVSLKGFLLSKFDLHNDGSEGKIKLQDLETDSEEFQVINEFISERLVEIPRVSIDLDEVIKNV